MSDHPDAVKEVFDKLGIDGSDIKELREFRKDLEWARANRRRCENVLGRVITYIALAAAGFGLFALWEGIKTKLGLPR